MTAPHKHTRPLRFARQPIDYERDPVAEITALRERATEARLKAERYGIFGLIGAALFLLLGAAVLGGVL